MKTTPIFIIGTPRSGTTLCGNILGRHSKIFVPGETHFFTDIYSRRDELGNPADPDNLEQILSRLLTIYGRYNETIDQLRIDAMVADNNLYENLKTKCFTYKDILDHFMTEQARKEGKIRWANHAPKDIFNIEDIISLYPNAKIILCIRDVRDFLVSYKNKWTVTTPVKSKILKTLYHPVTTSLQWKASMKSITYMKKYVDRSNLFLLKYENLVKSPESTLQNVCTFISESYEAQMVSIKSHNSSSKITQNGIFTSSIGRWHNELTDEEVFIAQKITKYDMKILGYDLQPINPNPIKLFWCLLGFPMAFIKAICANRKSNGPMIVYVLRRAMRLFG